AVKLPLALLVVAVKQPRAIQSFALLPPFTAALRLLCPRLGGLFGGLRLFLPARLKKPCGARLAISGRLIALDHLRFHLDPLGAGQARTQHQQQNQYAHFEPLLESHSLAGEAVAPKPLRYLRTGATGAAAGGCRCPSCSRVSSRARARKAYSLAG